MQRRLTTLAAMHAEKSLSPCEAMMLGTASGSSHVRGQLVLADAPLQNTATLGARFSSRGFPGFPAPPLTLLRLPAVKCSRPRASEVRRWPRLV